MGPGYTVGDGENVLKDGPEEKSQEVQGCGMHARVHMGKVGGTCVKETGGGRKSKV